MRHIIFNEETIYMNYDLIQTIIGVLGLIPIFLLWRQIKNESKWEKLKFSINKIDISLLETNGRIILDSGIDMKNETMSDEEYNKLIDEQNIGLLFKVQDILDMFENFATLYNMNLLNKYFAYEIYSETTIFYYLKFNRIIDFYRNKYDPFYYNNFEICACEFIKIRYDEQKIFNIDHKKLEKFQDKIRRKPRIFKEKF